ncbi:hypothetical protein Glove_131g74 [Diversispora epigaea]|uniref:Uncharacterized protein n=1 Tax=Diversispora epigaea TaxID=1348612 RepID=A0A397IXV9_9GLOM|nr:hypothetical protein Glove_131g74 [Diversispora epigaea]
MKDLYVKVLEELLIKRNEMKKRLFPLGEKKEYMELVLSIVNNKNLTIREAIKYILRGVKEKDHIRFTKNLDPFINKENHEFISNDSPFFSLPLAGSVTSASQYNIKDLTDSLYLVCPKEHFRECDIAYNNGNGISKEKYWSRMVKIFMELMGRLRDEVNAELKKDNETPYLKITYKEVLFPVVFTGQSKLFRKVSKKIMQEFMEINNNRTLQQIVEDVLKNTIDNSSQIDINECVKTFA